MDLKHKKVALLGYGVENRAMLPYLQRMGAAVTICDRDENLDCEDASVLLQLGPEYLDNLTQFDLVFRSPGLPHSNRQIQAALRTGVWVSSQTKYFFDHCKAAIIGVTGTKGKGTTSSLIEASLQEAAKSGEIAGRVYLAGNIGIPMISILDRLTAQDWVILELSSFQLEDLAASPDIAVVLNVSVDHLDHHKDETEYISAKKNMVRYQDPSDFLVVHQDSVTSRLFADESPAQTYYFSRQQAVTQGAFVEAGKITLRMPGRDDQIICTVTDVPLVGDYNLENVTAAVTAAALAGASVASLRRGITQFTGLPHRLQLVGEVNGVKYFDDSKSTTPDSTMAAVASFDQLITLIIGGSSKGADYAELVAMVKNSSVSIIIFIGQEGRRLHQLFSEAGAVQELIIGGVTMQSIVKSAADLTESGGVVLLSPAAASFDMFRSAEDRGNQFQSAVATLAH